MQGIEQRRATILFADVLGFTETAREHGIDLAYEVVSRAVVLLDGVARRHGGAIDKYLGDSLMAVFGAPLAAEDAPQRAVAASLEMAEAMQRLLDDLPLAMKLSFRAGLNTGLITVGEVGEVVREFRVLGDPVNVAARLKAKAKAGQVLVGAETLAATEHAYRFEELAPIPLKGRTQAMRAGALLGRSEGAPPRIPGSSALRLSDFVGREAELERLAGITRSVQEGRGGIVVLRGEAGVGKSRLVSEWASHPINRRLAMLEVSPPAAFEVLGSGAGPGCVVVEDAVFLSGEGEAGLRVLLERSRLESLLVVLVVRTDRAERIDRLLAETDARDRKHEITLEPLSRDEASRLVDALDSEETRLDPSLRERILDRARGSPRNLVQGTMLAPALRMELEREGGSTGHRDRTERRRATVLFADLTGFTGLPESSDPLRVYRLVTESLSRIQAVAERYGGTVEKHLGDCVMAVFGVPVALEDAPRAAINAAIEIREEVARFCREYGLHPPLGVHTGIETGIAITGDVSGPVLRERSLLGMAVERSDRLTDQAPAGEIHVGAETRSAVGNAYEFEPQPAIPAPGGGDTASFRLLSRSVELHRKIEDRGLEGGFVGRERELGRLRDALAELTRNRGGIVHLVGEAGLGKSRLLAEARKAAPEHRWLTGRSSSQGQSLGLHVIGDLIRDFNRVDDQASTSDYERIRTRLSQLLDEVGDRAAPLFAQVAGIDAPAETRAILDEVSSDALTGDALPKLLLATLTLWLRALAREKPTVVVLEDVHWADESSLELIGSLLQASWDAGVLFVLTYRTEHEEALGALVEASPEATLLRLRPLAPEDTRTLVEGLFEIDSLPTSLRRSIQEKCAGNPLFALEVLRSLVDAGSVERGETGLRADESGAPLEIPGSLQDVLMSRVDRLPEAVRRLADAASVLGREFDTRLLLRMAGAGSATGLEPLVDLGIITRSVKEGGAPLGAGPDRAAFPHPLLQEVVYGALVESDRRELHGAAGRAIQDLLAESSPGVLAMLAYHFSRAGEDEQAEEYLLRAGEEAARSAAANEALVFFQEALRLYRARRGEDADPTRLARLEQSLAEGFFHRGRLAESVAHFNDALEQLGLPRTGRSRIVADLGVVLTRLYTGRARGARRQAGERERRQVDILFRKAISLSTTDPTGFFASSLQTIRVLSACDPRSVPEAGAIYAGGSSFFSFGGLSFGVSRRLLSLASELERQGAVNERALYLRFLRFLHHYLEGEWSTTNDIAEADLDEGIRTGKLWEVHTYRDFDGLRRLHQGRFEDHGERLDQMRGMADLFQHDLARSSVDAHTALRHLALRELDEARDAAGIYLAEHDDVPLNLIALGILAKVEIVAGRLDSARAALARGRSLRPRAGRVSPFHSSLLETAEFGCAVAEAEGLSGGERKRQLRATRSLERRALRSAAWVASERPEVLRTAGTAAWLGGRQRKAETLWRRSIESSEGLGARPELARTQAELARRALESDQPLLGETPDVWNDRARTSLRELGALRELGLLDARTGD